VSTPSPRDFALDIDEELNREVQAALGDASVMELYEQAGRQPKQAPKTSPDNPPPGVIRGKVIAVSNDDVFIDLGSKSQAALSRDELADNERFEVGQTIDVSIIGYDQKDGLVLVSRKGAEQQLLRRKLHVGGLVEARVVGANKGGLEVDLKGIRAFIPASQVDFVRIEDLDSLIGEKFICEVIEVERGDNNIVLSRRNVLARERQEQQEKIWEEIAVGQNRHGVVRSLADYGAFVDIGGVDGLLHVSEMSWSRVNKPEEILQPGQQIDVLVIGIDQEKQRISLSLKQAGANPWSLAEQNYPIGSQHKARVVNLQEFGAFAELEPGLEGLVPISEMSWAGRIRHPRDVVQPGAMIDVEIISLDPAKQRMSLSMKRMHENPWDHASQKYVPDQVYNGTVARLVEFGAFVTLEEGVDGLIHISEMADKHVNRPGDVVKVGQEVSVRVLNVDTKNQRIALSLKAMAGESTEASQTVTEQPAPGKKKDRPRRGGLTFNDSSKWGALGNLGS